MSSAEHGPEFETLPPVRRGRRWGKWVRRGLAAALVLLVLVAQWPLVKGVMYAVGLPTPSAGASPQWRESYEAALAESRETGKPVLIDFTATWCPPCRVMEADVWPDADVRQAIAERVVPLQLDVDEVASARAANHYGVQYIPTILLVDGEGHELARGAFMSAGAMVTFIEKHAPRAAITVAVVE